MTEVELAQEMAAFQGKGYVIAPAGFGKTHLIALAVKSAQDRQLILTHTFAGVNALKSRMKAETISSSKYRIETIASFALRICLAYPKNANWNVAQPISKEQWEQLYASCLTMLSKDFIKRIICASYSGIYVDEYQDCSNAQHKLVMALSILLPCRILGDPLQAIFEFDEAPIDWEKEIYPTFTNLGELTTPWRWKKSGADQLGEWLKQARHSLLNGMKIDLKNNLPANVSVEAIDPTDFQKSNQIFYRFLSGLDSVMVIYPGAKINRAHGLTKRLGGRFSSIEESEGNVLSAFIMKITNATTSTDRLKNAIEFAENCMSNVQGALPAAIIRCEKAKITANTKNIDLAIAANNYYDETSSLNLRTFFQKLKEIPDVNLYRRDLFYRTQRLLSIHIQSPEITLQDAAIIFQSDFRINGRPIKHNKLISTTLLVKGLEFDHAVILDTPSLSIKEIYVALTRGSKSITIITSEKSLPA